MMGYGRFVGRVGTLAAALGIGFAVASSPAVAWADTDDTAPSASRDDDRTESDRQPRRTQAQQDEKSRSAATVEVKRQSRAQISERTDEPNELTPHEERLRVREVEDIDDTVESPRTVPYTAEKVAPQPTPTVTSTVEMAPPEASNEPATEVRTLSVAMEPLSAPEPEIPGESPILLAMLAAARRPSTTESRQVAGIQSTELVGAVPNTNPTVTSISARTPGLFTAKVRGRVRATDPDRDKLTYSATAAHGTVTINSWGLYTYTPTAENRHASAASATWLSDRVNVTVTDGYGGVATTYIDVVIRPKNYRPSARATVAKGNPANGIVTGRVNVTDRDGDAVTYTGSGSTSRGTVVVNADGTFVYTPTAAAREAASSIFRRSDRFTVTVNDGHGSIKTVGVRVGIVPPSKNAAPTVGNPSYTITGVNGGDGTVTGYVNMADPDGFGLTYSIAAGVAAGTGSLAVNAASGNFTFTPTVGAREHAHGTPGEDTVRFTIAGSDGLSTATVEVTAVISPKAPPPPPPPPPPSGIRWPLASVSVNRYFGGSGHNGIDLRASTGTPVYAAADGVINFEGYGENHSWMREAAGISVLIWHPSLNIYTGYAHLSRTIIDKGQTVTRGQLIGYSGYSGYVIPAGPQGAHLHFEVLPRTPNFSNGYSGRIDPLPYLR